MCPATDSLGFDVTPPILRCSSARVAQVLLQYDGLFYICFRSNIVTADKLEKVVHTRAPRQPDSSGTGFAPRTKTVDSAS